MRAFKPPSDQILLTLNTFTIAICFTRVVYNSTPKPDLLTCCISFTKCDARVKQPQTPQSKQQNRLMTINQTLFVSGFHRSSYCPLNLWSWLLSPTFQNQQPIYSVNTVLMVCFQITTILHKNHDKILVGCQGFFILASDWLAHSYYTIKI